MHLREGLEIGARRRLFVGGCDTVALAREYGTPLYIIDEMHLRHTVRAFVRAMKRHAPGGRVTYASKAFINQAMCRMMHQEGVGVDVVSGGELLTAVKAGFPMGEITYHGSVKTIPEIEFALAQGVGCLVIDSVDEVEDVQRIAAYMGKQVNVAVRLNPGIKADIHDKVQTARADSKFGLGIDDGEALRAVKEIMACENLTLVGVHAHLGSQIFDSVPYDAALDRMTDFMVLCAVVTGCELRELNLGGGFGVRYTEDQGETVSPDRMLSYLASSLKSYCARKGMRVPSLTIEPGRAIIAEAGVTLYTVEVVKEIEGVRTYVSIDGGMMDNPRPALYGSRYSILLANRADEPATQTVTIVGRACETDIIQTDVPLPPVRRGDTVAMLCTGAYQYAMASNYNRVPLPAVVLAQYGRSSLMVERQTWEDVIRFDRLPPWLNK